MSDFKNDPKHPFRDVALLDELDREILRQLSRDSSASYSKLGEMLGLSAAAAHDRVKKLKREGVIEGTVAVLNYSKLDRLFLAFVQLKIDAAKKKDQIASLSAITEIEEIHSIAGEFSLLVKVRTHDTNHMEMVFEKIYAIEGILSSQTIIAFKTYLERPMQV